MPRSHSVVPLRTATLVAALWTSWATPSGAQWLDGGNLICGSGLDETKSQSVADGLGHVWIGWRENAPSDTTSSVLRITRWNAAGNVADGWTPCGLALSTSGEDLAEFALACDGGSGVYVAWIERDTTEAQLFCQHLDASGSIVPGWPSPGIPIGTLTGQRSAVRTFPDGQGGIYVGWRATGPYPLNLSLVTLRATRLAADGTFHQGWSPQGNIIRGPGTPLVDFKIEPDEVGGLIVVWSDLEGRTNGIPRMYLDRFAPDGTGSPGWNVRGTPVSSSAGFQDHPVLEGDGLGGAFVLWHATDFAGGPQHDLAQHFRLDGGIDQGWPSAGADVLPSGLIEDPILASDGAGGAYVAFASSGPGNRDVLLARMATGSPTAPGWPGTGYSVTFDPGVERPIALVPDKEGGVLLGWRAAACESCAADYHVQRRLPDGTIAPGWDSQGALVATGVDYPGLAFAAEDATGGMLLSWSEPSLDLQSDDRDSRMQRILPRGLAGSTIDVPAAASTELSLRAAPNPSPGAFGILFELPGPSPVEVAVFDLSGRTIWTKASLDAAAGPHRWTWDGQSLSGVSAPPGVYFLRMHTRWGLTHARLVRP